MPWLVNITFVAIAVQTHRSGEADSTMRSRVGRDIGPGHAAVSRARRHIAIQGIVHERVAGALHPARLVAAPQQPEIHRVPRPPKVRGMEQVAHIRADPYVVRVVGIDRRPEEGAPAPRGPPPPPPPRKTTRGGAPPRPNPPVPKNKPMRMRKAVLNFPPIEGCVLCITTRPFNSRICARIAGIPTHPDRK